MKKILLLLSVTTILLSGCSNNAEVEKLKKENEALKAQLNEYQGITETPNESDKKDDTSYSTIAPSSSAQTSTGFSFEFIDPSDFSDCLANGTYKCGVEFEPGDYYIVSMFDAEACYDVSDTPNDFPGLGSKIIHKINVKNGQYIKLGYAFLVPEKLIDLNNLQKYGIFLVGKDFPAGEYKIESVTDMYQNKTYMVQALSAYQITSDSPFGKVVESSMLFDKQSYITLQDGQYITMNNLRLTPVNN